MVFRPPAYSVRVTDLLSDIGLPARLHHAGAEGDTMEAPIDWVGVAEVLEAGRADAAGFLDNAIRR